MLYFLFFTYLFCLKGFSRFLINFAKKTPDCNQNEIFVHLLRKDYSMKFFKSKRFLNKNKFGWDVFWIMVSRSLDVSQHFSEHLSFCKFVENPNYTWKTQGKKIRKRLKRNSKFFDHWSFLTPIRIRKWISLVSK